MENDCKACACDRDGETRHGAQHTCEERRRVQWEYTCAPALSLKESDANTYGIDGWEMVGFAPNDYVWFKRPA